MAEIQFKEITKRYPDGFEAVKDMNLNIGDGRFMILVGPSGCGKSTALRMIARLEDITEGELVIGGERVNELGPRARHRDGVPELRAVSPHDRARQHGLRAQARQGRKGRDRSQGQRGGQDPRPPAAPRSQAGEPVGRPAPAGGHGRAIVRDPKAF
jgi:multiple sugar transport system ATP-binding protein